MSIFLDRDSQTLDVPPAVRWRRHIAGWPGRHFLDFPRAESGQLDAFCTGPPRTAVPSFTLIKAIRAKASRFAAVISRHCLDMRETVLIVGAACDMPRLSAVSEVAQVTKPRIPHGLPGDRLRNRVRKAYAPHARTNRGVWSEGTLQCKCSVWSDAGL